MNKVIFLDRDGVLNLDLGYTHKFEDKQIIYESIDLIKFSKKQGYKVIVVTNQSGIGRGYYSEKTFHQYMRDMSKFYYKQGALLDDYFYAPYYQHSKNLNYTSNDDLRKPNIGMLTQAFQKYNLDKTKSILVGDKESDIAAGIKFGIHSSILYDSKSISKTNKLNNVWIVNNLKHVLELPIW